MVESVLSSWQFGKPCHGSLWYCPDVEPEWFSETATPMDKIDLMGFDDFQEREKVEKKEKQKKKREAKKAAAAKVCALSALILPTKVFDNWVAAALNAYHLELSSLGFAKFRCTVLYSKISLYSNLVLELSSLGAAQLV